MPSSDPDGSLAVSLANRVAREFGSLDQVEAVALSGSQTSERHDSSSDVDLYVYVTSVVPLEIRRRIAAGATRAEIGNEYWEPGDEWIDRETGIPVDVMFRNVSVDRRATRPRSAAASSFRGVFDMLLVQRSLLASAFRPAWLAKQSQEFFWPAISSGTQTGDHRQESSALAAKHVVLSAPD